MLSAKGQVSRLVGNYRKVMSSLRSAHTALSHLHTVKFSYFRLRQIKLVHTDRSDTGLAAVLGPGIRGTERGTVSRDICPLILS